MSRQSREWKLGAAASALWRKSSGKPKETGIKAVIAGKTAERWEQ
jgi:hypothetical protein